MVYTIAAINLRKGNSPNLKKPTGLRCRLGLFLEPQDFYQCTCVRSTFRLGLSGKIFRVHDKTATQTKAFVITILILYLILWTLGQSLNFARSSMHDVQGDIDRTRHEACTCFTLLGRRYTRQLHLSYWSLLVSPHPLGPCLSASLLPSLPPSPPLPLCLPPSPLPSLPPSHSIPSSDIEQVRVELKWRCYALSASKAIFRARTYSRIPYSVRWLWLLDGWK